MLRGFVPLFLQTAHSEKGLKADAKETLNDRLHVLSTRGQHMTSLCTDPSLVWGDGKAEKSNIHRNPIYTHRSLGHFSCEMKVLLPCSILENLPQHQFLGFSSLEISRRSLCFSTLKDEKSHISRVGHGK
jgi:hypothetical protein